MERSQVFQLLRRPGFVRYFATVAGARATGTMFTVSGVLLILERTHDLALAGIVVAAASLAAAITGPFLGGWLDVTVSRRRLLVLDRVLTALALAAILILAGHAPNWLLPIVALLYGATSPLSSGAFSAVLPEVAGPDLLDAANAFEGASINVAFVVGPALAGLLVATGGPPGVGGLACGAWGPPGGDRGAGPHRRRASRSDRIRRDLRAAPAARRERSRGDAEHRRAGASCDVANRTAAVEHHDRRLLRACLEHPQRRVPRIRPRTGRRRARGRLHVGGRVGGLDARRLPPDRASGGGAAAISNRRLLPRDGSVRCALATHPQLGGGAHPDLPDGGARRPGPGGTNLDPPAPCTTAPARSDLLHRQQLALRGDRRGRGRRRALPASLRNGRDAACLCRPDRHRRAHRAPEPNRARQRRRNNRTGLSAVVSPPRRCALPPRAAPSATGRRGRQSSKPTAQPSVPRRVPPCPRAPAALESPPSTAAPRQPARRKHRSTHLASSARRLAKRREGAFQQKHLHALPGPDRRDARGNQGERGGAEPRALDVRSLIACELRLPAIRGQEQASPHRVRAIRRLLVVLGERRVGAPRSRRLSLQGTQRRGDEQRKRDHRRDWVSGQPEHQRRRMRPERRRLSRLQRDPPEALAHPQRREALPDVIVRPHRHASAHDQHVGPLQRALERVARGCWVIGDRRRTREHRTAALRERAD